METRKYDFCGWATRNDLVCSDGRIIRKDAFKHNDGLTVPLVWNHQHDDPNNILGHCVLENRDEGVYAYGYFNNSSNAGQARELLTHGDICGLSIYANKLKQNGTTGRMNVTHGNIREVSLVLAGANPGAYIDCVVSHSDEDEEEVEIATVMEGGLDDIMEHSDKAPETEEPENKEDKEMPKQGRTIKEVFDEMTEEQKNVVYALVGMAAEDAKNGDDDEEDSKVQHNVFDNEYDNDMDVLSHAETEAIFADAKRNGSLRDSVMAHTDDYGITNINYLFPEDRAIVNQPELVKRNDDWVSAFMGKVHHTPFSRVKTLYADITADEARAKGYVKGNLKVEEVIVAMKRNTSPTTIYKKQKLDRNDIIDITDFDVVNFLKGEMRSMLNEEIARAALVGDGRSAADNDKVDEQCIRPIWTDSDVYTIKYKFTVGSSATDDQKAKAFIKSCVKCRKDYKGSGNPTLFTTEDVLTSMLLMEDTTGRVIYDTMDKLKTALRVSNIVTVPVLENLSRTDSESATRYLWGILVNPDDYNIGADKGGEVNMFDDFDIDFNQEKYLMETRCSGAMRKPYAAVALEMVVSNS